MDIQKEKEEPNNTVSLFNDNVNDNEIKDFEEIKLQHDEETLTDKEEHHPEIKESICNSCVIS